MTTRQLRQGHVSSSCACVQNRSIRPCRNQLPTGVLFPSPLSFSTLPDHESPAQCTWCQDMLALVWKTTLHYVVEVFVSASGLGRHVLKLPALCCSAQTSPPGTWETNKEV